MYKNKKVNWLYIEYHSKFQELKTVQQNDKWHKEGDVYTHTCLVVQEMLDKFIMNNSSVTDLELFHNEDVQCKLVNAALLHDVGKKVVSFCGEDGKWHAPNHEEESVKVMNEYITLEKDMEKAVGTLIASHMKILKVESKEQLLEIVNSLYKSNLEELLILKECDILGAYYDPEMQLADLNKLKDIRTLFYQEIAFPVGTMVNIECVGEYTKKGFRKADPNKYTGIIQNIIAIGETLKLDTFSTPEPVTKIINKNAFRIGKKLYKIYE